MNRFDEPDNLPTTAVDAPGRVVFRASGDEPGPSLVCLVSIHGNEQSGLAAVERVAQSFTDDVRASMKGDFVCVVGNRTACRQARRFISHDLNRVWTPEHVRRIRTMSEEELDASPIEDREQRELLDTLEHVFAEARGPVHFLDLHTTSAKSRPFVLIGDTLRNRLFARHFPVPIVLGLEEQIDGAITEWVNMYGHISVGFESGRHDDADSIDRHEAGIWVALVAAGLLRVLDVPDYEDRHRLLAEAAKTLPRFIEVRYRHGITPDARFRMKPGFENFARIEKDEVLATDAKGDVRAKQRGRILLPLYQGEGSDGFFVARRVSPIWLQFSAILRYLRADRLAPLLPGVTMHPERNGTLLIDPKVARWHATEVFHLLGYRKRREEDNRLVVSRRPFDF